MDGFHVFLLSRAQVLDVSRNKVSRIQGVSSLVRLRELYLSGNSLAALDGVGSLPCLEVLDVSDNVLTSLKPLRVRHYLQLGCIIVVFLVFIDCTLQRVKTLTSLFASRNEVSQVSEVSLHVS
jgi:Leucine-rich repeat (LRR) protein